MCIMSPVTRASVDTCLVTACHCTRCTMQASSHKDASSPQSTYDASVPTGGTPPYSTSMAHFPPPPSDSRTSPRTANARLSPSYANDAGPPSQLTSFEMF